jgi:drug/metabolite transporter (DMT)-like permease
MLLEPVVAIVVATIALGQRLTVLELLGGAAVLGAVVLAQLPARSSPARVALEAG